MILVSELWSVVTKLPQCVAVKSYKGDAVKKQYWARLIVNLAIPLKT
jgi:hypothetical protein